VKTILCLIKKNDKERVAWIPESEAKVGNMFEEWSITKVYNYQKPPDEPA